MQAGADQLKDWVARRGFNQTEAADYLEIDESFMSLLINGKRIPGLTNAVNIERKTGVPIEAWASDVSESVDGAADRDVKRAS